MSSILPSIVFIKSASGSHTIAGVATSRIESDSFIDIDYKAFRTNNKTMIQEINANSIVSIIGKFTFEASELNVNNHKLYIDNKTKNE